MHRQLVLNVLRMAKRDRFAAVIEEHANNPRAIFATLDCLLYRKKDRSLPRHQHPLQLAKSFKDFFYTKIARIGTYLTFLSASLPHATNSSLRSSHAGDLLTER